ncbi:MAG: small multi-drug export protein [Lachnospiraceae bacterium]|jgi:uncharacterized membrane protein|nr:small multi-drug export protein [Lachnospiraceae bacterium]MEE3461520.1 small multi-drug export protein [Lachnospiraceae bacterium]
MAETLAKNITEMLSGSVSKEMIVFIISMLPILELRGGTIAAALMHVPFVKAAAICVVGNLLPIPFILLLVNWIFTEMKKSKHLKGIAEKLEDKALKKSDNIRKYEFAGLLFFVGIPLPGTGAWTGALIAALLRIDIKKSFLAITLGVLLALLIMCTITYFIPWVIAMIAG